MLTITGVSLYAVAPSLVNVSEGRTGVIKIEPWWLVSMLLLETGSFVCLWRVQQIALRAPDVARCDVAACRERLGRIVPGGAATAGALQYRMLTEPASAGPPRSPG